MPSNEPGGPITRLAEGIFGKHPGRAHFVPIDDERAAARDAKRLARDAESDLAEFLKSDSRPGPPDASS